MEGNPVLKKLGLRDQNPVLIINSPAEYKVVMDAISAEIHDEPRQTYRFVHLFVRSREEMNAHGRTAIDRLDGDGHLWVSYPKKSSKKYTCDISRDEGWDVFGQKNFEPVMQVSIDEDWSALRFRRVDYIKTMKRKSALSQAGEKRIKE
jgi:hypothetical protein